MSDPIDQCYYCARPLTNTRQWLYASGSERPVPANSPRFRMKICRGTVACTRRRIAALGEDSVPKWAREWLDLDGSRARAERRDRYSMKA